MMLALSSLTDIGSHAPSSVWVQVTGTIACEAGVGS
jgi:hypothetical protein